MTNRFWKIEKATSFTQQNVPSHRPKTAVLDSSDIRYAISDAALNRRAPRKSYIVNHK
jgi:hypothetical protein